MPVNRRQFLASSAALGAITPLGSVATLAAAPAVVVVESAVPESRAYARHFAAAARISLRLDAVQAFAKTLRVSLDNGAMVSGCTREASGFVIGELLRGTAFSCDIVARHRFIGQHRLRHHVRGGAAAYAALDHPAWPGRFAGYLEQRGPAERHSEIVLDSEVARDPDSPGTTQTWRIVRR